MHQLNPSHWEPTCNNSTYSMKELKNKPSTLVGQHTPSQSIPLESLHVICASMHQSLHLIVIRNIAPSMDRSYSSGMNGSDPEQMSNH